MPKPTAMRLGGAPLYGLATRVWTGKEGRGVGRFEGAIWMCGIHVAYAIDYVMKL